jgi:hypothetical protein
LLLIGLIINEIFIYIDEFYKTYGMVYILGSVF